MQASIVAALDVGTIFWMSFFKGPLVGYEKLNDRHFVAYSAAWSYNSAKSLVFDGQRLWFSSHLKDGLISFYPSHNRLECYESFQGRVLPTVEKLEFHDGILILDGALRIPVDLLMRGSSFAQKLQVT